MAFLKFFTLAVCASTLATATALSTRYADTNLPTKRSAGTVAGAEDGVSYFWNTTETSAQCPTLLVADLATSLAQFDPLFPPQYDAGPFYEGQTVWPVGALYLTYPEGTYAFYLEYTTVTPNSTATWVDSGADIANVWSAIEGDIVSLWSQNTTFQFIWYDVTKTVDGVSNHAGQFKIQVQTPTFVKGCDTSCGGHCNPNICTC